jgi:hypothetical protein
MSGICRVDALREQVYKLAVDKANLCCYLLHVYRCNEADAIVPYHAYINPDANAMLCLNA